MASEGEVHGVTGKLSQLLADTIINLHPHVSRLAESEREAFRAKFLDGLEDHSAELVGPLLNAVTNSSTLPSEIRGLVQELGAPTEQFTGIISQFFVFGIMFTLAQAMLAPFVQQLNNDIWSSHPDRPISPPDIATAVVRGIGFGDSAQELVPQWAFDEAKKSGFGTQQFATMVGVTGMAPALQLLFEMIRRGIIEEGDIASGGTTLVGGIKQSDVKDEWIPFVSKLRYIQPSPIDMVRAAVQDQWDDTVGSGSTYDEAKKWAQVLGLEPGGYLNDNPDWFNLLYNTAGRPPGPVEMMHAANRGLTDWDSRGSASVSFSQAISESDIKDKYIPLLKQLAVYWPPSGEVGSLLKEGGLDVTQAESYWAANGVPPELAKAYLYVAQIQQVTQDRAIAKADILTLIQENAITDDEALTMLAEVGYSGTNAEFLIEMAHFRFELEALRNSVRTVSNLYTTRKINAVQAKAAMQGFGIPQAQIDTLLATLTHQLAAETAIPTAAQIASALYYGVVNQSTAMAYLQQLGYDPVNAYILLSVRMHGPLPNPPPGYVPVSSGPATPPTTGTGGPIGPGDIAQGLPTTNTVVIANASTFADQLTPTSYNLNPVTYSVLVASPLINVSSSGLITLNGTPLPGAVQISGTMTDNLGSTGTWAYTLTFN